MTAQDCKEVFARLSEYLDEDLPSEVCDRIERHIDGCPPCVEFVESLRRSIDLCRRHKAGMEPGPMPAAAREDLVAAYRKIQKA